DARRRMSAPDPGPGLRLSLRRDPLRLVCSAAPWSAAGFLAGYLVLGAVWFAIALAASVTAAVFAVTLAGLPLLVAASSAIRFAADGERHRVRHMLTGPLRSGYRSEAEAGIMAQVRTRWRDPATWRDLACLFALWPVLLFLDLVALTIWLALLGGIAAPLWYRYPEQDLAHGATAHGIQLGYFPHGPAGPGGHGIYITTMSQALIAAACFLAAFLLFNYVLIVAAQAHTRIARALLRPPADPLAGAKSVLAGPRPLGPLKISRNGNPPVSHSS
ncbi:MAG: sensor domain-containing protein, partial [Actinomycetota bacterium]